MGANTDAPDGETITQYSDDALGDNDSDAGDENGVTFYSPGGSGKNILQM